MSRMLGSYNSKEINAPQRDRGVAGHLQIKVGVSATQLIARDLQSIKIAERGYCDSFGLEEFLS